MSIAKPEPGRRPVEYRPEIGSTILDRLDKFETLRDICADPAMPDKATVLRWVAQHAEFRDEYAVTPRLQAEALMEETTYIIDDALSGCLGSVRGGKVVRAFGHYALARALLRNEIREFGARRELVVKLTITPQGERLYIELGGERGNRATGLLLRADLRRMLRMLEVEVLRGKWVAAANGPAPAQQTHVQGPSRH